MGAIPATSAVSLISTRSRESFVPSVACATDSRQVMKEACGSLACDESFDEHAATRSKLLEPDRNNSPMPGA
jgi:hypothetical protein